MAGESQLPSNRSFGRLFTAIFAVIGAWSWWRGGAAFPWLFGIAALFGLVTLLHADWLASLNRAWMRLAALLHRVVSPIVLGVMYFGIVTPYGLVMRLAGHDPMRRRLDPSAPTYWIPREPPGPPPESLRDQF